MASLSLPSSIMMAAALKSLSFSSLVQATNRNIDARAGSGETSWVDSPELDMRNGLLAKKGCLLKNESTGYQLAQGQVLFLPPPGFHQLLLFRAISSSTRREMGISTARRPEKK